MSCMVAPASCTSRLPASTRSTEVPISCLISRAAVALRCARARTSPATTAKPRPCSPARAASTAAFRARMLVWKAMPSITPMISAMRRLLWWMSSMVDTTWVTTSPPRCATLRALAASPLACCALPALCCRVLVNCSMAAAVSCRLLEVCSVRTDRSWLPVAISALAMAMLSVLRRTCCTTPESASPMAPSDRSSSPNSSPPPRGTGEARSPAAMRAAAALASASGLWMPRISTTPPATIPASSSASATAAPSRMRCSDAAVRSRSASAASVCDCAKSRRSCR